MTEQLTIIGITAKGWDDLTCDAQRRLTDAQHIYGSARQLALLPPSLPAEQHRWQTPLATAVERLVRTAPRHCCILATGDPFVYGIGTTILRYANRQDIDIIPQKSAFCLARNRMGWNHQETCHLSLHGRSLAPLYRHLAPKQKILALTDKTSLTHVIHALKEQNLSQSQIILLANLDSPDETHIVVDMADPPQDLPALYVLALRCADCYDAAPSLPLALCTPLPDEAFYHDGTITKQDFRALTLQALNPLPRALLWDVGSGCGTLAIEWCRLVPHGRAIAIERQAEKCAFIAKNQDRLHIMNLEIINAVAPQALIQLPEPNAIFIGGGISANMLQFCWQKLAPYGFLVVNAVTLESQNRLLHAQKRYGGKMKRWQNAHNSTIGSYHRWQENPAIVQWQIQKP